MGDERIEGFVAPGFEPVRDAFAQNFAEGLELGAGFAATLDGETIVDLHGGYADRNREHPWTPDTLVPVFSTTKPIAALVVALLVEQGKLVYDAPVAALWPDFAAHGKQDVSLAQALSHQAGVPGFPDRIDPALWLDPPALAAALAGLAPMWPPGTANGYHPLTFGYIAGEMVRRASGATLGTILRERLCAPNGVDFWIGLPEAEHERCADVARPALAPSLGAATPEKRAAFLTPWAAPNRAAPAWRTAEIPSANGHGTALAVALLYAVLARGGLLGKQTLLSPATFEAFTRERVRGPDKVLPNEMAYAAGPMRNSNLFYGPNPNTLAHAGWGGSMGLADPDRGLSSAYVMNKQSNQLQTDARAQRLIAALYGCL